MDSHRCQGSCRYAIRCHNYTLAENRLCHLHAHQRTLAWPEWEMVDLLMSESTAPTKCLYCDGTDPGCGFCEMGKPLDTQEDWDNSWGRLLDERD